MNAARWSLVILLTLAPAFHSAGQEKEQPKEYTNKLYPIGPGYRWHYRVTDLKAPKSAEQAAKQQVIVTAGAKQVFTLKKKVNDELGKNEQVYGYELEVQG